MIDIATIPQSDNNTEVEYWVNIRPIGKNHELRDLIQTHPDSTIEYTFCSDKDHYLTVSIYTRNTEIFRYEVEECPIKEPSLLT
jgi:hypothetical protein